MERPCQNGIIKQFVGSVTWGDLDYLVIDAPPGTGDEPLTVVQTIPDAKGIIVTTPQEVALADVRKSISFCKTVKNGNPWCSGKYGRIYLSALQ